MRRTLTTRINYFFLLFIAITCFSQAVHTQTAPALEWQKSLGGSNNDIGYNVQPTSDGGYVMTGSSASNDGDITGNHGDFDVCVIKLNSSHAIEWQKSFGGTGKESGTSIRQTPDGGYIVSGLSNSQDGDVTSNHGGNDAWVMKLNAAGILQWQKSLGGSRSDEGEIVYQTSDGGYIIAGSSTSNDGDVTGHHGSVDSADIWVVKLDAAGLIEWQKSLGGSGKEIGFDVHQTIEGGYIISGSSTSKDGDLTGNLGGTDLWVVKINSGGAIEWQKNLGGSKDDVGCSLQQTVDGGYIITGESASNSGDLTLNHGDFDLWVVKISSSGAIQWQKSLGGSGDDTGYGIQQTTDGGYVISGLSNSTDGDITGNHGAYDLWVLKLSSRGALQWQKSLGGAYRDGGELGIYQATDGGYIIGGFSYSNNGDVTGHHGTASTDDFWIVKLAPEQSPVTLFAFTGNGNWDVAANWRNNVVPPSPFPAGSQIVINPQPGGECFLNVPVTIAKGGLLSIVPGAKFTVNENLIFTDN